MSVDAKIWTNGNPLNVIPGSVRLRIIPERRYEPRDDRRTTITYEYAIADPATTKDIASE